MDNQTNQNDFKVVEFHNPTDFTFTPEMGCMFDGRPISGITGAPGINGGETITLPYHIAHRLAENLAKYVLMRGSMSVPTLDSQGNPIVAAIWDTVKLDEMKRSYVTELYTEDKPIAQSETDRLMAKVEELKKFVQDNITPKDVDVPAADPVTEPVAETEVPSEGVVNFQDKAEVIAELERLGIPHDKRKSKADLEALLPVV